MLGFEFNLTCHIALGVEGGIRYESAPEDDDRFFERSFSGFSLGFLRSINNDVGDRLSVPVSGFVKVRW